MLCVHCVALAKIKGSPRLVSGGAVLSPLLACLRPDLLSDVPCGRAPVLSFRGSVTVHSAQSLSSLSHHQKVFSLLNIMNIKHCLPFPTEVTFLGLPNAHNLYSLFFRGLICGPYYTRMIIMVHSAPVLRVSKRLGKAERFAEGTPPGVPASGLSHCGPCVRVSSFALCACYSSSSSPEFFQALM